MDDDPDDVDNHDKNDNDPETIPWNYADKNDIHDTFVSPRSHHDDDNRYASLPRNSQNVVDFVPPLDY